MASALFRRYAAAVSRAHPISSVSVSFLTITSSPGISTTTRSITTTSTTAAEDSCPPSTDSLVLDLPMGRVVLDDPSPRAYAPTTIYKGLAGHWTLDLAPASTMVAVLRRPFLADGAHDHDHDHDHDHRFLRLTDSIKQISPTTLAVHPSVTRGPGRLVADLYRRPGNGGPRAAHRPFTLHEAGVDLLEILHHKGGAKLEVCPDVRRAPPEWGHGAQQSTNEVLMVSPTAFVFNQEAARDNTFMHNDEGVNRPDLDLSPGNRSSQPHPQTRLVLGEYANLVRELRDVAGGKVHLFEHARSMDTPDACFPNNWFR